MVTVAVITWLLERGDEMNLLTITIIAIIVNFVIGIIAGLISKDGHVAIGAAIIARFNPDCIVCALISNEMDVNYGR